MIGGMPPAPRKVDAIDNVRYIFFVPGSDENADFFAFKPHESLFSPARRLKDVNKRFDHLQEP